MFNALKKDKCLKLAVHCIITFQNILYLRDFTVNIREHGGLCLSTLVWRRQRPTRGSSGQNKSNNLLQKADQVICFPGSRAASD